MTLFSLYLYLLVLFVTNNKHLFNHNNDIHKYNTIIKNNLYLPTVHLTKFSNGPYITGIRVLNRLPQIIKALDPNPNKFKTSLKKFFNQHPFYSIDEYFDFKDESV